MSLADMMSNFPDELTCDMAETYGIFDIKRVPARLLATLAVGLRDDSRVKMAKSGVLVDNTSLLLAMILDTIRGLSTSSPLSAVACCYANKAEKEQQQEREHETFDGREDFHARWEEITRK